MAKKGHTEEQVMRALRQAEGGTRVAEICREHGVSEATFYVWKKKFSGLALNELRELRQLREENAKLKRHRLGEALLGFVKRSLAEGTLTHTKAAQVLGVKPRNVDPLLSAAPGQNGH